MKRAHGGALYSMTTTMMVQKSNLVFSYSRHRDDMISVKNDFCTSTHMGAMGSVTMSMMVQKSNLVFSFSRHRGDNISVTNDFCTSTHFEKFQFELVCHKHDLERNIL